MSRIGKQPIKIEAGTDVSITNSNNQYGGQSIQIKGPKGQLMVELRPDVDLTISEGILKLATSKTILSREAGAYWGLYRTLLANAVNGVVNGYSKELEIVGIGYKAENAVESLKLTLGFTHVIDFPLPKGISVEIKEGVFLKITGIDKQLVGETAAKIRSIRKPEPYKGKGVRYKNEVVKRKAGKAAAK